MRKESDLFQHFSSDEREFAEKIIEMCHQVEDTYSCRLTYFLNPRQEIIVKQIANYFKLQVFSTVKVAQFEYSRVIIAPPYYELDYQNFDMMGLEISYPIKFHNLTHSQVLGSFLNQLGIKREYLGDILLNDGRIVVLIDKKFGKLAIQSINKISKVPVKISQIDWTSIQIEVNNDFKSKEVQVSNLRLDKIVAVAFNLSRTSATKLIESSQVKLDYVTIGQTSKIVELGQLISVRKFGRIHVREFLGFSKQGKVKLKLEIIKT